MIDVSGIRPSGVANEPVATQAQSSSMLSRIEGLTFAQAGGADYAAAACMSFEHHFES